MLVAARNEEENLPSLLESLAAQDYPPELCEFVIIDDGSSDSSTEIVGEWINKDARFKSVPLEDSPTRSMGPKKRALTEGVKVSSGDIILITDADCVVPSRWVSGVVECFGDDTAVVCGMVRFRNRDSFWSRLAAFEGVVNAVLNSALIGTGRALSCFGANFAYRRRAFEEVGGYDLGSGSLSGDDDLLLQKIQRKQKKVCFNSQPDTIITTSGPENSAAYWSRKRRHLSAGKRYAPSWIILAVIIYLGSLSTVLLGLLRLIGLSQSNLYLAGWGLLSVCLFAVFLRGVSRLHERGWAFWGIVAAILFPVIFSALHGFTLLPSPSWKGRNS